jgi:hypothetical protein
VCSPCHMFCNICKSKVIEPQSIRCYKGVAGSLLKNMLFFWILRCCGICQFLNL